MPNQPLPHRLMAAAAVAPLIACAQAGALPAGASNGHRVLLVTQADWPTPAAVAERSGRLAGVAVRALGADAPRSYSLSLACADAAACREALRRIAAEPGFALSVEFDTRQRLPARPSRDASR